MFTSHIIPVEILFVNQWAQLFACGSMKKTMVILLRATPYIHALTTHNVLWVASHSYFLLSTHPYSISFLLDVSDDSIKGFLTSHYVLDHCFSKHCLELPLQYHANFIAFSINGLNFQSTNPFHPMYYTSGHTVSIPSIQLPVFITSNTSFIHQLCQAHDGHIERKTNSSTFKESRVKRKRNSNLNFNSTNTKFEHDSW